jgi:PleD family two-component response regulator
METILIIDDEPDIVLTWTLRLEKQGYQVLTARNGQEGLALMVNHLPDLVLLDIVMPKINGLELCRRLKHDPITARIPIIMLTAKGTLQDKILGIETGADDYITKDTEPAEVEARVRMVLRRYQENIEANPLTQLPGNNAIETRITELITSEEAFSVGYADLDNFKAYNDTYGFQKGDEVIRQAGRVIVETVKNQGGGPGFVGHIGGDDFIFITTPETADQVSQDIIGRLDRDFPRFYAAEDRDRGFIVTKSRLGKTRQFPLMTISIALVSNRHRRITSIGEVAQAASEVKKHLKTLPGSNYAQDKRDQKTPEQT